MPIRGQKKERREVITCTALPKGLLYPAIYARWSHLCGARYPQWRCKNRNIFVNGQIFDRFFCVLAVNLDFSKYRRNLNFLQDSQKSRNR